MNRTPRSAAEGFAARVAVRCGPVGPVAGFTLVELVVSMGILTGFLLMLTQLVGSGVSLFRDGEAAQAIADRAETARRVLDRELRTLRGDGSARDRSEPVDRLVVQELPIGLPARPEPRATHVQVLRAAVHLPLERELQLRETMLVERLAEQEPDLSPAARDERLAVLRQQEPRRGLGSLILLPWRQEGDDDALLELRAGWLLPGQRVPTAGGDSVDPMQVLLPGSPELPSLVVAALTEPILRDLLHVEFRFWGQTTRSWRDSESGGPFRVWDSARAGWLNDVNTGGVFALDRGPDSLADTDDDVHPHAVLVRCVVAQPAELAADGLLAAPIGATDEQLELVDGERFPGDPEGGWIKVDGEWMRYDRATGDVLYGLSRGQRRTRPIEHAAGVRVHVGRSLEFVVPLPHGKDDWNG